MGTRLELTVPMVLVSHFNGDFALLERSMQYAHDLLGSSEFVYLGPVGTCLTNEERIRLMNLHEQQLRKDGKTRFVSFYVLREFAAGPTREYIRASEVDQFFMRCPNCIACRESSTDITSELKSFSHKAVNKAFFDAYVLDRDEFHQACDPDFPPLRRVFFSTVEGPCAFKDGKRIDVADEMVLDPESIYFMAPGPLYYPEKGLNTETPNMLVWRREELRVSFHTVR